MGRWFSLFALLTIVSCSLDSKGDNMMPIARTFAGANMTPAVNGVQNSSSGGWQASGTLRAGDPVGRQVSMQANFPQADVYTVQFRAPSKTGAQCVALITWSVEGGSVQRTVDVGAGVSVSGVGAGVKVTISDNGSPQSLGDYDVAVQVSRGNRASTGLPPTLRLTHTGSTLPGIVTQSWPIPNNSGAIAFAANFFNSDDHQAPTLGQIIIECAQDSQELAVYDVSTIGPGFIPIPVGTNLITVHSYIAKIVIYNIYLGIDG